jgi:spore maturation protein CgeB
MRLALFYHSLISDWNHGNAHFLRGVCRELLVRGHDVRVFEPGDAWSAHQLVADHGQAALAAFHAAYPELESRRFPPHLDLDEALDGCDAVIVHEWNDPQLVARIGEHRARQRYRLLFHDTHHRAVTAPHDIARYDLRHYDGVLACGRVLRDLYLERAWAQRAWTWHEAADVTIFKPEVRSIQSDGDVIWIGTWGEDERGTELGSMLIEPVAEVGVRVRVHGARFPDDARAQLAAAGIEYAGWLPDFLVPIVFARHAVTFHLPCRRYVEAMPGIPTIRLFEALACGIPLISAFWRDDERLFTAGEDYLVARDGAEMKRHLRAVLGDRALASRLAARGRRVILTHHTCAHRVDELFAILGELSP